MTTQKGAPSLAWRPTPFDHVPGDARLRDLKPELEQCAVDAWRAPVQKRHLAFNQAKDARWILLDDTWREVALAPARLRTTNDRPGNPATTKRLPAGDVSNGHPQRMAVSVTQAGSPLVELTD
mgnify:CR=1 FL=1